MLVDVALQCLRTFPSLIVLWFLSHFLFFLEFRPALLLLFPDLAAEVAIFK